MRTLRLLLAAVLLGGSGAWAQAPSAAADLDEARSTLSRWVETQQIISKERGEWETAKEVLEQRIAVLGNEIAALEERIRQSKQGVGEVANKEKDLAQDDRELDEAWSGLRELIVVLERRTLDLDAMLPAPLRDRLEPLSRRIPADPAQTPLSLGVRYQNVIGMLNEINKFNREITVTNELRQLASGGATEVSAMYIGLGQAYYVSMSGDAAGVGMPAAGGWQWTEANDLAKPIAEAIAIIRNEHVPAYVPLPAKIQ